VEEGNNTWSSFFPEVSAYSTDPGALTVITMGCQHPGIYGGLESHMGPTQLLGSQVLLIISSAHSPRRTTDTGVQDSWQRREWAEILPVLMTETHGSYYFHPSLAPFTRSQTLMF
jgi:hypothetical protein